MAFNFPLTVGVSLVPLAIPPASVISPKVSPKKYGASLVPLIVIVISFVVPSTVVTVNVSVRVSPTFKP